MASYKPFNCHSRLWLLLSRIIELRAERASNPDNDSEDSEVDYRLEKCILLTL